MPYFLIIFLKINTFTSSYTWILLGNATFYVTFASLMIEHHVSLCSFADGSEREKQNKSFTSDLIPLPYASVCSYEYGRKVLIR